MAVRAGRTRVSHADFDEAIEKHALGIAKRAALCLPTSGKILPITKWDTP